jgi:armadillo repeat-containing protein 8
MIREQTLNLIRNIGCGRQENIDEVFNGFGNSHFIEILESNIQRLESQQIILQTLYIIVNIATGSELHKSRIMESTILLQSILNYLVTNLIELYLKILIF